MSNFNVEDLRNRIVEKIKLVLEEEMAILAQPAATPTEKENIPAPPLFGGTPPGQEAATTGAFDPFNQGGVTAQPQPAPTAQQPDHAMALAGLIAGETVAQMQAQKYIKVQDVNLITQLQASLAQEVRKSVLNDTVVAAMTADPSAPGAVLKDVLPPEVSTSLNGAVGQAAMNLLQTPGFVALNGSPTLG